MISPGVFTQEYIKPYLPQAIGEIGACAIGPTPKGRAFIPTKVSTYQEYIDTFGAINDETYMPYAVRAYLENSGTMTIVRVLNPTGYSAKCVLLAAALSAVTGSNLKVVSVLHPTYRTYSTAGTGLSVSALAGAVDANGYASASVFNLNLSGTVYPGTAEAFVSMSLSVNSANYLGKNIGKSPKVNTVNGQYSYRYSTFDNYMVGLMSGSNPMVTSSVVDLWMSASSTAYSQASTPDIISQTVNNTNYSLFTIKSISEGQDLNSEFKIGILNIKNAGTIPGSDYGTFSIVVRSASDTDRSPNVLEQFNNLTLDPKSTNYIARVIGDTYYEYNTTYNKIVKRGDYDNLSKYIYVVVTDGVKNGTYSETLVPYGFAALKEPIKCPSGMTFPTASFVTQQLSNSAYNSRVYFGFNFDYATTDNLNYLKPYPTETAYAATTGSNIAFKLDNYFSEAEAQNTDGTYGPVSLSSSIAPISAKKFLVPFQGGFDGFDPSKLKAMGTAITSTNTMGLDCSTSTAAGYKAYKRAIDLMANTMQYDVKLLITPGILQYYNSGLVQYAIDMVESRGDCFYVFDTMPMDNLNVTSAVNQVSTLDSSYAATYYPWVKIFDSENNKYTWVPPSTEVIGAYSYNDKYGGEWYAPAGLNRGTLSRVKDIADVVSRPEMDILYDGRVNPVAFFPNEGPAIWGQKTLQSIPNPVDRVNVRRLLINLKKFIASIGKYLVFDNNTSALQNKFLSLVNPYMDSVQKNNGLYAFKCIMDETTNTNSIIDRNIMYGKIFIQPAKTTEFLLVDFNVTETGASFSGI